MLPEIIVWLVVFAIGVPSAWRNPTAAALVISWILGELCYLFTGDNLPTNFYLYPDIAVIAVIMAKHGPYGCPPDSNTERHLRSAFLSRSVQDYVILLIFPVMWLLYAINIHPFYKWWSLWLLVVIQFFLAAWEAVVIQRRMSSASREKPRPPFGFEYRMLWGGRRVSVHGP